MPHLTDNMEGVTGLELKIKLDGDIVYHYLEQLCKTK